MEQDKPPSPGGTRRGGVILGHSQSPPFRPLAGRSARHPAPPGGALYTLTDRDRNDLKTDLSLSAWGMHLQIVVFRTKATGDVTSYFQELRAKANALFAPHGLQLVIRDFTNVPLANVAGAVLTSEDIDQALQQAQGGGDSRSNLKVIFCTRQTATATAAPTDAGATVRDAQGVPYVLINTQASTPDRITLAHEIGHAAGLHHEPDNVRHKYGYEVEAYLKSQHVLIENNFMSDQNNRTRSDMFAFQVNALGTAPFATPGNQEG